MTFEVHLSPNKYNDILLIPSSFAEKEANPTLYIDVFVSPILTTHSLILSINYSFTAAYSTVTQSRASLPDVVGALTWIAPYAPHHSSFVPVYASAPVTPSSMNTGTQCTYEQISINFS